MFYPVTLTKDNNGTILVRFPDVPDAVTFGDTKEEAKARVVDAILTVLDAYMHDRRPIPAPMATGRDYVDLPVMDAAKLALYQAMMEQRVSKSELGRRLNVHLPQVDRILKVRYASKLGQIVSAFEVLGKGLEIRVVDRPGHAKRPAKGQARAQRHRMQAAH